MQVTNLVLKNFRCFQDIHIAIAHPLVLIEGANGSGKTSVLEALHYACYLRSFRTHTPRELIQGGQDTFFIKATLTATDGLQHEIHVGVSGKKRIVKLDKQPVDSYKQLMDLYRVITITQDDTALVSEGPEFRRSFLDQALILDNPLFITDLRSLKQAVERRNRLFFSQTYADDAFVIWTEQLQQKSEVVQHARRTLLAELTRYVQQLVLQYFPHIGGGITLEYKEKAHYSNVLFGQEKRFGRSLFGAHLDDIVIRFAHREAKNFASRGQQKLIVILLKIAQSLLLKDRGVTTIILLDDFLTDFDETHATLLLSILTALGFQLIFTAPTVAGVVEQRILSQGALQVRLTP